MSKQREMVVKMDQEDIDEFTHVVYSLSVYLGGTDENDDATWTTVGDDLGDIIVHATEVLKNIYNALINEDVLNAVAYNEDARLKNRIQNILSSVND